MYTIYKHTSPSGKAYIGLTKNTMMHRWKQHRAFASSAYKGVNGKKFWSALRKYQNGWIHTVLGNAESLGEANALEGFYIAYYDTWINGYNSTPGGNAIVQLTEAGRQRMVAANTGQQRHIKPHSEESKNQISATKSKRYLVTFPDGHTEETVSGLRAFCKQYGLDNGHLYRTLPGARMQGRHLKTEHHKGYKAELLNSL
jgi:hypothetical protein